MAASVWESNAASPGSAASSTSAKPSPSPVCFTGCDPKPMKPSHIAIIGAPLDLGQGRRGVDMGPSAMRVANLNKRLASLGYEVEDLGNVPVEQQESLPEGPRHAKFLPQISAVCERLGDMVTQASMEGKAPLVIGGGNPGGNGTVGRPGA